MDIFNNSKDIEEDSVFLLQKSFKKSTHKNKVNLGIGYVLDQDGDPAYFNSVQVAKKKLLNKHKQGYLPISGFKPFLKASQEILFGNYDPDNRLTIQTLGGTGAISLAISLWKKLKQNKDINFKPLLIQDYFTNNHNKSSNTNSNEKPEVYIPNPTWVNHSKILDRHNLKYRHYRYYDFSSQKLDFNGLFEDLTNAPSKSLMIFQLCGHNPTGIDLGLSQWNTIADCVKGKDLLILFDVAYQGLSSGDLHTDSAPLNLFIEKKLEFIVAQSFSKNFGLYGERIGALHFIFQEREPKFIESIKGKIEFLIRTNYSTPPTWGAKIVSEIWNDPKLKNMWLFELKKCFEELKNNRKLLYQRLSKFGYNDASLFLVHKGLFSLLPVSLENNLHLRDENGIFFLNNGRINFFGINKDNVDYIAENLFEFFTN